MSEARSGSARRSSGEARKRWLRLLYYLSVTTVVIVVGYRVYLEFVDAEFESAHVQQVQAIQERLEGRESFRFAVVGNVNNSIGVFERQIIPRLNASGVDFVVSAGNAVSDGGADKYRALRGALERLEMPYLLAFGGNEASRFGASRFYRQFGPYFFAFTAGDARFVFLDSSGETSHAWQVQWLEEELTVGNASHVFLVTGRPMLRPEREPLLAEDDDYLGPPWFREALTELVEEREVDAVFAAQLPVFDHQLRNGTHHVTTGGAGGLVVGREDSFHHWVTVSVRGGDLSVRAEALDVGQHPVFRTLESLWLFVHSLFFVGYLNFLLIVGLLVAVSVKLHGLVFVEKDYYPRFDVDPSPFVDAPLRVAMFTNNYLPSLGGVPIAIDRLRRGLTALGKSVLVVAPRYGADEPSTGEDGDLGVLRVPSLVSFRDGGFRLTNILLPRVRRAVRRFDPDVVHFHHPFWMSSLALWLARRLDAPAVFTYHTRLEHYADSVPLPGRLFRNLISHLLIRRSANRCLGVVVPTVSAREYLRAIGVKSRIVVRATGVEYARFHEVDPEEVAALRRRLGIGEEPVLVSVSRLSEEKNIGFMIEALGALCGRTDPPFRFLMVGDGPQRAALEARIEALGLGDRVIMPGAVPPELLPAYYHLGDVFVFASMSETQGMVVLEAMAAGLPVVAVRSSGVDDLVRDGINGYKTAADREQWLDRVHELLLNSDRRADLASGAREFARANDLTTFASEIAAFYAEVVAHHRAPRGD